MSLFARLALAVSIICLFAVGTSAVGPDPTFVITGVKYKTSASGAYIEALCNEMGRAEVPLVGRNYTILVVGTFTPTSANYSGQLIVIEDTNNNNYYSSSADPTGTDGNWSRTITAATLPDRGATYDLLTKTGTNSGNMTVNGQLVNVAN